MMHFCAFCYDSTPAKFYKCGQCKNRIYCSPQCQRNDWKCKSGTGTSNGSVGCHKLYCRVAGEIGVDYEVRDTERKGVGVGIFALRDFVKNDIIIVERPLIVVPNYQLSMPDIPPSAKEAVKSLLPTEGSLQQKLDRNAMACSDSDSSSSAGLFLTLSRINHHCNPNADHQFMNHRGVKLLVASRTIRKDEEIFITYVNCQGDLKDWKDRRTTLREYPYNFQCNCSVCTNSELETQLARTIELDNSILDLGSLGKVEAAMLKGKALIKMYDDLQVSAWFYQRTYYDLFQVAITKKKHCNDGKRYIRLAHQALLAFVKDNQHPEVLRFENLIIAPQTHRNYLLLDGM